MSERRSPTEERLTPPKCLNYSSASPTSSGYLGRPSPQAAPESPRGKPTARNFPPELGAPLLESAARGWEESERSGQGDDGAPQRESALATHGKAAVYGLINAVVVADVAAVAAVAVVPPAPPAPQEERYPDVDAELLGEEIRRERTQIDGFDARATAVCDLLAEAERKLAEAERMEAALLADDDDGGADQ